MVCVPLTAFHLMVSPVEMRTVAGDQWVTIPFTVFVARVGVWRSFATAAVAATTVKMRNATRTSDEHIRRIDIRLSPRLTDGTRSDDGTTREPVGRIASTTLPRFARRRGGLVECSD